MKRVVKTAKGLMKPCNGPTHGPGGSRPLPLCAYYRDASTFSGFKSLCKDCCRHKALERWRADPAKHRAQNKAWREAVRERRYASMGYDEPGAGVAA